MTETELVSYCRENAGLAIQDVFKFLHQSCFGPEHLVTDEARALAFVKAEAEHAEEDVLPETEALGTDYIRLHLKVTGRGLSAQTLTRLFLLSSKKREDGAEKLTAALGEFSGAAAKGLLPFDENEIRREAAEWREAGYPALHHSEAFRAEKKPAYRVIRKAYLRLLPLLIEIDRALETKNRVLLGIDGRCASGKTTLAAELEKIYGCAVFHADDFFLRPEQRTKERLSKPGGNMDRERLKEEVILPLSRGEDVTFQRWDCRQGVLLPPETVRTGRLSVVEGAYCLHPELKGFYDVTAFLSITEAEQRERILKRNGAMAERFFNTWIPLEEAYFRAYPIEQSASVTL